MDGVEVSIALGVGIRVGLVCLGKGDALQGRVGQG